MKCFRLIIFLMLFIVVNKAEVHAQTVRINGDRLIVKNNSNDYTQKFILSNGNTISKIALPGREVVFQVSNNRNLKHYRLTMVYDIQCYQSDLGLINQELQRLIRARQRQLLNQALWRLADQVITGGWISNIADGLELLSGIFSGKSYEDLTQDFGSIILEQKLIDGVDGRLAKGLAAASFSLLKLGNEENFPEITRKTNLCLQKLKRNEITNIPFIKSLYSYNKYELRALGAIPVSGQYKFEGIISDIGSYKGTILPYNVSLINMFNKYQTGGWFLAAGYSQSPLLYKPGLDSSPFAGQNAFSFNSIDLGVGLKAGTFYCGFMEIGARSFFINQYYYNGLFEDEQKYRLTDYVKNNSFVYDGTGLYFNLGFSLNFKVCDLVCSYNWALSSKETENKKGYRIDTGQLLVGLSIPLVGSKIYY